MRSTLRVQKLFFSGPPDLCGDREKTWRQAEAIVFSNQLQGLTEVIDAGKDQIKSDNS